MSGLISRVSVEEFQAVVPELRKIPAITEEEAGYLCPQCRNFGAYRETDLKSSYYGMSCRCDHPKCPVYRKEQALVHERLMKHAGISLDTAYGRLTFETWDDLPSEQIKPKKTARFAAERLCKAAGIRGLEDWRPRPWAIGQNDARKLGLVLAGEHGVGKTGLLASIVDRLALNGHKSLFVEMFATWERYKNKDFGQKDPFANKLIEVPYLLIDEFNMESRNDKIVEFWRMIIRGRHGRGLPIVMSTNHASRDSLKAEWESRIATALWESCHFVKVPAPSFRVYGPEYE